MSIRSSFDREHRTDKTLVSALWYWGWTLNGQDPDDFVAPRAIIFITWPLAAISITFAALMFWGLPEYYHQIPPYVPNFFKTLFRRKLVIWFLIAGILRDYWLSGPYGRNWQFLWQAADIPKWAVVIMIVIFFIGIWGLLLGILISTSFPFTSLPDLLLTLSQSTRRYTRGCCRSLRWVSVLPDGPRSGGVPLGWVSTFRGPVSPDLTCMSPFYLKLQLEVVKLTPHSGVSLWLWLGVLDAIQGAGLGMMLLQTLSRLHVCATLALAQFIGSATVMVARATSPTKVGPGNAFPNPGIWDLGGTGANNPFGYWEFWVCLACQIIIVIGFAFLFRKEQLSKP